MLLMEACPQACPALLLPVLLPSAAAHGGGRHPAGGLESELEDPRQEERGGSAAVKRWSAATAEILALVPTIGRYYLQTFIGGGGCGGCRSLAGSLRDRDISPDAKATAPPRPAGESAALALGVQSKEVRALVGRWDFWASVSLFSHWLPGPAGVWEAVLTGGDATPSQKKRKLAGRAAVAVMLESALGGA